MRAVIHGPASPGFPGIPRPGYSRAVTGLLVLATSIAVAYFLGRGLEPWRPTDMTRLTLVIAGGVAAPLLVAFVAGRAQAAGTEAATFLGFAGGVILIGYMVLAGAWALRFLAEQVAQYR